MTEHIFLYRLTNDTGCAPCIFENGYKDTHLLSLACCKGGQLRCYKKNGKITAVNTGLRWTIGEKLKNSINEGKEKVYIIGIYKNCILYIAILDKVIKMTEYYNSPEYSKRLDYIYNVSDSEDKEYNKVFQLYRNNNNKYFHPKEDKDQHRRDELGKYVLLSKSFAYFGKKHTEHRVTNEKLLSLMPKKQETKYYKTADTGFEQIKSLIEDHWDQESIVKEEPSERIKSGSKGCYQK